MNKFYISIPNSHSGNELKWKVSGLYSSFFYIKFSVLFQKKTVVGGTEKSHLLEGGKKMNDHCLTVRALTVQGGELHLRNNFGKYFF